MSPACWAPASEMAPATRLVIIEEGWPGGVIRAKKSWVSFEMPETGFRSVWPGGR